MKKMNLAVGILILLGFMFIIAGIILKTTELNLLRPISRSFIGYLMISNTCFLVALVMDKFDKMGKE